MTSVLTVSAALLAWLGAGMVAVSDGRRGFALGLCVTGTGLAIVALLAGDRWGAAVLLLGGIAAGALRLRDGPSGWRIMPPGSTPRIILSLAALAVGTLVGVYLTTGPGTPERVAAVAVCGLSVARLLTADRRAAAVAAAAGLSLALGTMGSLLGQAAGAAVAVALSALSMAVSGPDLGAVMAEGRARALPHDGSQPPTPDG